LLSIANHNSAKSATAMTTILTVIPNPLESPSATTAHCTCAHEAPMSGRFPSRLPSDPSFLAPPRFRAAVAIDSRVGRLM
jgi:hypothetical protein